MSIIRRNQSRVQCIAICQGLCTMINKLFVINWTLDEEWRITYCLVGQRFKNTHHRINIFISIIFCNWNIEAIVIIKWEIFLETVLVLISGGQKSSGPGFYLDYFLSDVIFGCPIAMFSKGSIIVIASNIV